MPVGKIEDLINEGGLVGAEREYYQAMGEAAAAVRAGVEPDIFVQEALAALKRQGAEYIAATLGWPLHLAQGLADAGVFDRAIRLDAAGWPYIDDLVLPLALAAHEEAWLRADGRITAEQGQDLLRLLDDAIEQYWPVEGKCAGPWSVALPDGSTVTLGFMERAWRARTA